MFGRRCIGVPLESPDDLWTLAKAIPSADKPVTDGLGLGIIAYWPGKEVPQGVKWSDDEEDDEE